MVNQLSLDRKDFNNNHPYLGLRYLLDGIQEDQPCLIKNLFPLLMKVNGFYGKILIIFQFISIKIKNFLNILIR